MFQLLAHAAFGLSVSVGKLVSWRPREVQGPGANTVTLCACGCGHVAAG